MEYKGYRAAVTFDDEADVFHGEVVDIGDVIIFEATSVARLEKELQFSIDDYLNVCEERGRTPDSTAGSFPGMATKGTKTQKRTIRSSRLEIKQLILCLLAFCGECRSLQPFTLAASVSFPIGNLQKALSFHRPIQGSSLGAGAIRNLRNVTRIDSLLGKCRKSFDLRLLLLGEFSGSLLLHGPSFRKFHTGVIPIMGHQNQDLHGASETAVHQ